MSAPHFPTALELAEIRETFVFSAADGTVSRRAPRNWKRKAETQHIHRNGYARVSIRQKFYGAHRVGWFLHFGVWPCKYIDHINGNPSDNRITNLRLAEPFQNSANRKTQKNKKGSLKGASFNNKSKRWHAQIRSKGVDRFLGAFKTEEEAHAAYVAASVIHGEFANTGR